MIGSSAIWAMNDAHCKYMASIGVPRRGYVGDVIGQTVSDETSAAAALNSSRTSLVWPGSQWVNYDGSISLQAPYLIAAQVGGARAATPPSGKLTMASIGTYGLETTISPSTVDALNEGGVIALEPLPNGTTVISWDRTTWLGSTAFDKVENMSGLATDMISQDLNSYVQQFVGLPMTANLLGHISAGLLGRLQYWYSQNLIVVQPVAGNINLTSSGSVLTGTVNAAIIVPTNYIALTLNETVFTAG
jgi:hypothetical protein